ncbi:MAG: dTDP-4-dehydrorhamnose reductase [Acetobacteraceae bacterium]|nr:dTDP-4-dehydrorhamnose reductase [Acetobacteraceae bacterium]
MVTILVIGRSGQLATALVAQAGGRDLVAVGRSDIDFDEPETILRSLTAHAPTLIIIAAAYTAVDRAETEAEAAYRANAIGPEIVARFCARADIPLIHVSTDYVFDGAKGAPYVETDTANPIGVYGASKRAGEIAVLAACAKAIILRTSWVYAPYGRNFVLTMLAAAQRVPSLRVVADQIGCPTAAPDLAAAILAIADQLGAGWRDSYAGIYHAAGTGSTSWHGLACAAFAAASRHGRTPPEVIAITTADWPTPVRRPADSRLNCDKLAQIFGVRLPDWQDALDRMIDQTLGARHVP